MRGSSAIILAAALSFWAAAAISDTPPRRVVSINLCTDQLAMMIAAPGQLISVTDLAQDPRSSVMAETAMDFAANFGRAEEVYLLQPDLVLAGTYSAGPTVQMLERLGVPVVRFEPANSLEDITERLLQMGQVLSREAAAAEIIAQFESRLENLRPSSPPQLVAALYFSQTYTAGDKTLAGQILATSGFGNVADDFGLGYGGKLPLELLVMSQPDLVITGRPYQGHSRADEVMAHPAVSELGSHVAGNVLTSKEWVCGTPHALDAVAGLTAIREQLEAEQ